MNKYEIKIYVLDSGKVPFNIWFYKLDKTIQQKIDVRMDRVENGNLGDCKNIGSGIWELRIFSKSGYRIYFSKIAKEIVLLLCAGNKNTQREDIILAKLYLNDFKNA